MLKALRTGAARAWRSVKSTFTLQSYGGFSTVFSRLTASWGAQSHDRMTELAARNPTARRAIDFISQNLASIPLQLVRETTDGDTEVVVDHPVLDLLDNPAGPDNNRYGRRWMWEMIVWALMGGGEFWLRGLAPQGGSNAGRPRRLQLYDASDFQSFIRDPRTNFVEGYFLTGYNNRTVETDTDETLHAYLANPTDRDRGLPILLSVLRQLELLEEADEWNKAVAESKGQVPGFFKPTGLDSGDQIPPDAREQAQAQIDEHVNQSRAGNKWMVLSGSYEPMERSISPKDADWLEGSKHAGRLIAVGLGIDPTLLGDDEAKTYNNYSTALVIAYTTRILPLLDFVLDHLNRWLVPKFGDESLLLTYDRSKIDALDEATLQRVESLVAAVEGGIMTPDEARQDLKLDTIGADDLLVPLNVQTGEMLFPGGERPPTRSTRGDGAGGAAIADLSPEEAQKALHELVASAPGAGS